MSRKIHKTSVKLTGVISPLAKFLSGKLTCVICRTSVKSVNVWKVHINSRQHKQNVEATKVLKNKLLSNLQHENCSTSCNNDANVNPSKDKSLSEKIKETHQIKDIMISKNEINLYRRKKSICIEEHDAILPEQFFDDPIQDAKIRNVEYKDQNEDEWEKFQREIKEVSTVSNTIIFEDQEEATVVRQIEEIDEQIRRWTKVINLETQKELVLTKSLRSYKTNEILKNTEESSDESDSFEGFSDWRSKRFKN